MASESSPSVNAIPGVVIYDPALAVPRYATGSVLTNSTPQHVAIVDGDGTQITTFSTSHSITGGADGVTTVTTAGTDVALASSTACKRVTIQAQTDNTGLIAVGFTGVDYTEATGTGIILYPGDAYELDIDNLADIYIDASVSGDGVRYCYFN